MLTPQGSYTSVPKQGGRDWPPVMVASVFQTGLNLLRDFGRKGIRAVGIDCVPEHEGFRSVYGESHLCPDPDLHPEEWVAFVKTLAGRLGARPVFIAASDQFVMALGRHAGELEEACIFLPEGARLQAALCTKERQYELAARAGFPRPRTGYVRTAAELSAFMETARFPCLLKPRSHQEWAGLPEGNPLRGRKLVTAENREEMAALYALAEPYRPEVMAQEIVAGGDDSKYCYLSVYGRGGERLGYCVVREFRSYPVSFGSASVVQPVVDEEIASLCDGFLRSVGYEGICEIEVKRDARDGRVKLIEVNPRFSGTGDAAIYTGVDVAWLHYLDLTGRRAGPVEATRLDFRHITLRRDLPAIPYYLGEKLMTWRELLRSYRRPLEFFDFDWRDRRVTGETVYRACRAMAGGALRARRSPGGLGAGRRGLGK